MTPQGRAYAVSRLGDCHTLEALRTVWESLGREYQNDPEILALKEQLKATMK